MRITIQSILHDARFVRHSKIETESSLIAQGFDEEIVKELPTYTLDASTAQRSRARDSRENDYQTAHHLIVIFKYMNVTT